MRKIVVTATLEDDDDTPPQVVTLRFDTSAEVGANEQMRDALLRAARTLEP